MVFGVDDVLEFGILDILIAIGTEVITEITGTAAAATTAVGELFSNILGEGGISSLLDFVKMGAGKASEIGVNVASIDELGGITLKNAIEESGFTLWEAEPEIQQTVSKNFFGEKFKELAANLIKQGVDMKDLSARELLTTLVKKAITKGRAGIALTAAGGAALAPLGISGIINKFKKAVPLNKKARVEENEAVAEIKRF